MNFDEWQNHNASMLTKRLDWLRCLLAGQPTEQESDVEQGNAATLAAQSALDLIQQRFGLSDFETNCLFLCAAMEYDTRIPELCATAQESPNRYFPTPALCMQLFDSAAWDFLSPERPLKKYSLLEFVKQNTTPQIVCPMLADSRIVNFIRGLNHCDERLNWYLHPEIADNTGRLSASQMAVIDTALEQSNQLQQTESFRGVVFQLTGSAQEERRVAAVHVASRYGLDLRRLVVESIPTQVDDVDQLARLWNRECRLSPFGLLLDLSRDCSDCTVAKVAAFLARVEGLVVIDSRDKLDRLHGISIQLPPPTAIEQRLAWQERLNGTNSDGAPELLSGQFDLGLTAIDRVVVQVSQNVNPTGIRLEGLLWDACRHECRPRLDELAQRIDAKATWDDLVVPVEQMLLLKQIAGQVRHRSKVLDDWGFRNRLNRGFGINVLFAGESGTGKTMAAEVIANDLRLDLYRIDLSSVINKYIGETEKNLRKLFDAAESGGAILFFDEADALFGRRSEVKDSHDRYANIETNYLLQRLESFRGLAILASNNKSNMDSAFLRRLRFVVDFTFPEAAQRKEIWRRVFPSETPLAAFDPAQLAKIGIAGGNIHNIALNAAFAAAANRDSIDMSSLLDASRSELIKAQKPLSVPGVQWPTTQEALS